MSARNAGMYKAYLEEQFSEHVRGRPFLWSTGFPEEVRENN